MDETKLSKAGASKIYEHRILEINKEGIVFSKARAIGMDEIKLSKAGASKIYEHRILEIN